MGIGFAIPVNTAKRIMPQLISKGYVSYPYAGATVQPVFPELAKALKLKVERGAMVIDVSPGGPADKAGLRGGNRQIQVGNVQLTVGGDVIVQVDQFEVKDADDLIRHIREKKPGRHRYPESFAGRPGEGSEDHSPGKAEGFRS